VAPVYTNGPLHIFLKLRRTSEDTVIEARYVNTGSGNIEQFSLQAAVPKTMTLTMQAASGSTISPGAPVTQSMRVIMSPQHGEKPVAMRLKLSWVDASGQIVQDMATISRVD
jgi:AP-1 complex subunit gamma-1